MSLTLNKKLSLFKNSIQKGIEEWKVPGVSYVVVDRHSVIAAESVGVKYYGHGGKVDHETLFPLASLTKSFTAGSLALLVDQGLINFHDRVIHHDSEFLLSDPYITSQCQIDDLLCHRIGLPKQCLTSLASWGYQWPDILKALSKVKFTGPFRANFSYINSPFAEIMRLFLKLTGINWQDFLKSNLLKPLSMDRACIDKSSLDLLKNNLVYGHCLKGQNLDEIDVIDFHHDPGAFGPAGGLYGTALDVAKWVQLHLNHGKLQSEQFITSKTMNILHKSYINLNKEEYYGLGLIISYKRGIRVLSHVGALATCSTYMGFCPEKEIGIVVLSNQGSSNFGAASGECFWDIFTDKKEINHHQLMRADYLKLHDATLKVQKDHANPLPPLTLNEYIGAYQSTIGTHFIEQEGESLFLRINGNVNAELKHFHRDIFVVYVKGDAEKKNQSRWGKIHFSFDNSGKVSHFLLDQECLDYPSEQFIAQRLT